ncbi:hypothetical protein NKG60_30615 [Mesorhizobium sp. M1428]|uniref:hypothetical protein n=1 Tax=Mesorhizobium sp. M1428 TaxID=2957102 RepID=UPI003336E9E0
MRTWLNLDTGGALTAGRTASALAVTAKLVFVTYASGRIRSVKAVAENTAAAALNVNGIGAKSICKNAFCRRIGAPGVSCSQQRVGARC